MSVTVKDILTELATRFDAGAAGDWQAKIQFCFGGEGEEEQCWLLSVADGACSVAEEKSDSPSATVKTTSETWIGMSDGTVNPMQAFMTGKLKVEGDMGDVMKLQNPQIFKPAE